MQPITNPLGNPLKAPTGVLGVSRQVPRIKTRQKRLGKQQEGIRGGDWFGCGRVITTESWEGFLKARAAYWAEQDKKTT